MISDFYQPGAFCRPRSWTPPMLPEEGFAPFTSTKPVECARIKAAEFEADGSGKVAIGGGEVVQVPKGFLREPGTLNEGDVLIRYSDGYLSWIPQAKFEAEGAYWPRLPE